MRVRAEPGMRPRVTWGTFPGDPSRQPCGGVASFHDHAAAHGVQQEPSITDAAPVPGQTGSRYREHENLTAQNGPARGFAPSRGAPGRRKPDREAPQDGGGPLHSPLKAISIGRPRHRRSRTIVESIMTYRLSGLSSKTWNILSRITDLAQQVKRLWTLFRLP